MEAICALTLPAADLQSALRGGVLALYLLLVVRLRVNGLHAVYRLFLLYLVFRILRSALLLILPTNRSIYAQAYVFTEPILWVLYVLVILELYSLAVGRFPGIATLGRWVLGGALTLSVVLSLVSLIPDLTSPHPYPYIHLTTTIGRAVCSSLALFLLAYTVFLVLYRVPLSRNLMVHSVVYSLYFLTLTMAYFVHNVFGPQTLPVVNLALQGVASAMLLAWIVLLKPEGEKVKVASRPAWEPEDEERLVRHLDSINAALLRVARK